MVILVETDGSTPKLNNSATISTESHPDLNSSSTVSKESHPDLNTSSTISKESNLSMVNASNPENKTETNSSHVETVIKLPTSTDNYSVKNVSEETVNAVNATSSGRRLLEDKNLSESLEVGSESKNNSKEDVPIATVENDGRLEGDADSSFDLFRNSDELADEYSYDYDDYVDESMWGDEEWTEEQHEKLEDYVNVDAHILCTPVSFHFNVSSFHMHAHTAQASSMYVSMNVSYEWILLPDAS